MPLRIRWIPLLLLLPAAFLAACDDEASAPEPTAATTIDASSTVAATATPEPSPSAEATSPSAEDCPVDAAVCAFARQLATWLRETNIEAIFEHSQPTEVTCPAEIGEGGLDPRFPLCQGASEGEVRSGYVVGRLQSESGTLSEARLTEWLQTRFGSDAQTRELELATIGCPIPAPGAPPSCDDAFGVVFRAPEGAEPQSLLMVVVERTSGEPLIRRYYSGILQLNQQMVSGGFARLAIVDFDAAGTQYFPLDAPAPQ